MGQFPKSSVVVPVDLSEESYAAVDVGLGCVDDPKQLHVIHVLRDVSTRELEHIWDQIDQTRWQDETRRAIEAKLSGPKYQGIDLEIVFGTPGESIVAFAQRVGAELIVMPSHGRRGLSRMLLGSVAERVIRMAECPVLVVKAAHGDDATS